jgi:RimJ/RimL family protein N-acetyltransferase
MLTGRRVRLEELRPEHADFLYELFSSPRVGGRMRYHGQTPSPDEVSMRMWDMVLAQFLVVGVMSNSPLGLVVLSQANFRNRFCHFAVLGHEAVHRTGLLIEGSILMLTYAFEQWDFRKIYFESLEPNLDSFSSAAGRILEFEGRLRDYHFMDGRYVDMLIHSLSRERWDGAKHALLGAVATSGAPQRDGALAR